MTDADADLARYAASVHDEVPHEVQVSLSMSMHTRNLLQEIRDELNDQAGEPVLTTNDIVQLSLIGAARYYELREDADRNPGEEDQDPVRPLLATLRDAVDADDEIPLR